MSDTKNSDRYRAAESDDAGEYDGRVREIPYDDAQKRLDEVAEAIMALSREQLRINYERKGDGWQYEDARYHIWKACDEFFSACHAIKQGDIETMERRFADGWNHLLMASIVAYSEEADAGNSRQRDTGNDREEGRDDE